MRSLYYLLIVLSITSIARSDIMSEIFYEPKVYGPSPICEYDADKPKQLRCSVEQGSYLPSSSESLIDPESFEELIVVEYNVDRNGLGGDGPNEQGLEKIIDAIESLGHIDILILSEVARDCPEYGFVSGAQVIGQHLQMAYAYSVEYLYTDEDLLTAGYECTIGNAILANRPISKVMEKRFFSQCCQYSGRAGGRVVVKANIPAYNMTVLSSHLESGTGVSDFIEAAVVRELQSKELIALVSKQERENNLVLIGGDFNSPLRQFDKGQIWNAYIDPLGDRYHWPHRNTCVNDIMSWFGLGAFDFVYFKNAENFTIETDICRTEACYGYSDHFPVRFEIQRNQE